MENTATSATAKELVILVVLEVPPGVVVVVLMGAGSMGRGWPRVAQMGGNDDSGQDDSVHGTTVTDRLQVDDLVAGISDLPTLSCPVTSCHCHLHLHSDDVAVMCCHHDLTDH